jgi:hypothetical protein
MFIRINLFYMNGKHSFLIIRWKFFFEIYSKEVLEEFKRNNSDVDLNVLNSINFSDFFKNEHLEKEKILNEIDKYKRKIKSSYFPKFDLFPNLEFHNYDLLNNHVINLILIN